jgi:hypothetical protein
MPFEFIQIPANGQGSAKDELNKLLPGGRIASVRKAFVAHGGGAFWAFCAEYLESSPGADKGRSSKVRYSRRMRLLAALHEDGMISKTGVQQRLTALTAVVQPARSQGFRRGVMEKIRSAVIGREPGEPGRHLEQQRQQLLRREPQHPDEHAQQYRAPGGLPLRPQLPDGSSTGMGLNRPPSRSRPQPRGAKSKNRLPGLGSSAAERAYAPRWQFHSLHLSQP